MIEGGTVGGYRSSLCPAGMGDVQSRLEDAVINPHMYYVAQPLHRRGGAAPWPPWWSTGASRRGGPREPYRSSHRQLWS